LIFSKAPNCTNSVDDFREFFSFIKTKATAYKLDEVRGALRQGDIGAASKYGNIYELRQVTNV